MIALVMKFNLRLLYLYLFSFVGLLIVVIGGIQMVNLGLKTFVFKDIDKYEIYPTIPEKDGYLAEDKEEMQARQDRESTRQKQREFSNSLAMITVGLPLYLYHWKTIQAESK